MEELVFKYVEMMPELGHPIEALAKGEDGADVLIRNGRGDWVLARKSYYPEGMGRMVGGSLKADESPMDAIQRELQEETGVAVDEDRLLPLVHAQVQFGEGDEQWELSVFVFYCQISQPLKPQSDVNDFVTMSEVDLHHLIERMGQLSDAQPIQPNQPATWSDWGKVWGPIHAAALERVKEMGL